MANRGKQENFFVIVRINKTFTHIFHKLIRQNLHRCVVPIFSCLPAVSSDFKQWGPLVTHVQCTQSCYLLKGNIQGGMVCNADHIGGALSSFFFIFCNFCRLAKHDLCFGIRNLGEHFYNCGKIVHSVQELDLFLSNFLVHTESQAKKCVPENGKEKDPFEPLAVADPD